MRDVEETNTRASLMVENVTTRLNMARNELSRKERQVHDLSEKYHLACGPTDFIEIMDDIERNLVKIRQYASCYSTHHHYTDPNRLTRAPSMFTRTFRKSLNARTNVPCVIARFSMTWILGISFKKYCVWISFFFDHLA